MTANMGLPAATTTAHCEAVLDEIGRIVVGKREALTLILTTVLAGGHILIEDLPGLGKTLIARSFAAALGLDFKRVQFTPDLLPTDIVGTSLFNPQDGTFRFKAGPIFANVLIADEINRASPRTQSALLEGLSEQQVTVDGETRSLPSPFLCIATQNPVEFHGTYPLPEASLDRFAAQLSLGYPPEAEERALITEQRGSKLMAPLETVCTLEEVAALQRTVEEVRMEGSVADYLLRVIHATRSHASVRLGVSTRGALVYARMARARALASGRDFVLPEDLKALAVPVLTHRLVLDTRARYAGTDKQALTRDIVSAVPLPR
jgi:MoxR-like ATPase